jgi:hypothetical protein
LAQALNGVPDAPGDGLGSPWLLQGDVGARLVEIGDGLAGVAKDHRQRA